MNDKVKSILKTTVILVVISTLTTAALAVTNMITKNRISELNSKKISDSMHEALPAESYSDVSEDIDLDKGTAYTAYDAENTALGNVYITSAKGYGGDVKVMTAINTEGIIIKVKVLDATNETPGLGQNAVKNSFSEQFSGKSENITIKENADALTGATITSKAVANAVNEALELDRRLRGV